WQLESVEQCVHVRVSLFYLHLCLVGLLECRELRGVCVSVLARVPTCVCACVHACLPACVCVCVPACVCACALVMRASLSCSPSLCRELRGVCVSVRTCYT